MSRVRRLLALSVALAALVSPAAAAGQAPTRDVVAIGNNWDGTAHIVDAHSFDVLMHLNIVPDLEERRLDMISNPFYALVRGIVGEGHDQLVDDMFTSHDGRYLYVSRPSLTDVVAIDLATRKIVWRVPVDGNRSDHMAISPDGTRLLVSASTANVVDVIDTAKGEIVAKFPSGDSPHESNFSKDGKLVYHASIGRVYVPTSDDLTDMAKGTKIFELVDAKTWKILESFDLNDKLAAFGRPDVDGTIRPMALSPDERYAYFQTSFFHGFVKYDFQTDKVTDVVTLPARTEDYVLNSAHHGLAINHEGTKLCSAGTIDDYVAITHTDDFSHKLIDTGDRPYWSETSEDGKYCFVSIAEDDYVSVISFASEQEVAKIPVGRHPQRVRAGKVLTSIVGAAPSPGPAPAARLPVRLRSATLWMRRARRPLALRLASTAPVSALTASLRRGGRTVASGRLAKLDGRATLRLAPRRRGLRAGAHRLVLRGVTADGRRASRSFRVAVRRAR